MGPDIAFGLRHFLYHLLQHNGHPFVCKQPVFSQLFYPWPLGDIAHIFLPAAQLSAVGFQDPVNQLRGISPGGILLVIRIFMEVCTVREIL